MKKSLLVLGFATIFLTSCGEKKKEEVKAIEAPEVEVIDETAVADVVGDLELGKKLFTEKTCATCHQPDVKVIGPSISEIAKIYKEKNADIIQFLKGEGEPIVDPSQYEVMKTNFSITKNMSDEELQALEAYFYSFN